MLQPLLIEIGVEELPAIPFLKELPNIEKKYSDILSKYSLLSEFEFFYTPRRLTFFHREFLLKQPDSVEELIGAPVEIAIKDGVPTGAGLGFAKKCGVEFEALERAEKNGKEVLFFKKEIKGTESRTLLNTIINEFVESLKFGKSMRWGTRSDQFIRPIRSLTVMLGDEIIDAELFGVSSFNTTFVHRNASYEPIEFLSTKNYFDTLLANGVVLFQDERRELILSQIKDLEADNHIQVEIDEDLLDEVVAITEYPNALIGNFSEEFLTLPTEVIVTSMKEHQRYFAVYKDGKVTNKFVVVSNALTSEFGLIIKGNEKVLNARLSDALFFWHNDLKRGLSTAGLENVLYVEGLGSIMDKIEREKKVGALLYNLFQQRVSASKDDLIRAIDLAKADLMSEMVYEFTELQGTMGYYYATAAKESQNIANAIKEQYLPNSEDGDMPTSLFSSLVALSYKIDNLMGLFSIGMVPTGSRDPFALRRAAIGIIKIVLENRINFNIAQVFGGLTPNYKSFDLSLLENFFIERIDKYFDANSSVINAVIQTGERDIYEMSKKIDALSKITQGGDWSSFSATFKRVANITKDMDIKGALNTDTSLLILEQEKNLHEKFTALKADTISDYEERLDKLISLKPTLDSFFENVMVNDENESIKQNRKNLIANIYKSFLNVADISFVTT